MLYFIIIGVSICQFFYRIKIICTDVCDFAKEDHREEEKLNKNGSLHIKKTDLYAISKVDGGNRKRGM